MPCQVGYPGKGEVFSLAEYPWTWSIVMKFSPAQAVRYASAAAELTRGGGRGPFELVRDDHGGQYFHWAYSPLRFHGRLYVVLRAPV